MAKPNNANHQAPPDQHGPARAPTGDQLPPADSAGNTAGNSADHNKTSATPRIVGRRYHLYLPSVFYIIVTIFIGIGAFNAQNNLLFFVFGVTLATLVVSGILSGTMMMGVSVRRVVEAGAEVGKPAPIAYRVTNLNRRLPLFALRITEWPDKPPPRKRRAHDADEPESTGRLGPTRAFAAFVPGGGSIVVPAETNPLRAGSAPLRGFEVSTVFPFGIALKSVRFAQRAKLTIRQPTPTLSGDVLAALGASGRAQSHASHASRAQGEEFFGIREYTPGDPMRLIAWRASARSGDLRTRVQAAPPRPSVRLVLDLDGLDDEPAAVVDPDAPTRPNDPLGRALGWPMRMLGFIDDTPTEQPLMLSPMDRTLALSGSLAGTLLAHGFAVEIAEQNGRFAVALGSDARQRDRILDTLALRRNLADDPMNTGSDTTRQPDRNRAGLTVRLSPGDASMNATGPAAPIAPTQSNARALSYDQLDAAVAAAMPVRTMPEPSAAKRPEPMPEPVAEPVANRTANNREPATP